MLSVDERVGVSVRVTEIRDIRNYFGQCELLNMKRRGCFFIWNNKQEGVDRVFFKIDSVFCNEEWIKLFFEVITEFQSEGIFDYILVIVIL